MGTIRRYADGFRVQMYSPRDPETGKQRRPSRYVKAPDNRAGRKKAEAALAKLIVDHEHQPLAPKGELGTVSDLFDRWSLHKPTGCRPRQWPNTVGLLA